MTGTPLIIIGAAGTGRETLDIVEAMNREGADLDPLGVLDDSPAQIQLERLQARAIPYLGTLDTWLASCTQPTAFAVAIASPRIRQRLAATLKDHGHHPITLAHPQALLGSRVRLGEGTILYGSAQLSTNVTTGPYAILNANVVIGHDAVLGSFVTVNPSATVSGEVHLQDRVLIGGGATVLQLLTVGEGSVVGAAALVTRDVPPGVTVKGIPGRW